MQMEAIATASALPGVRFLEIAVTGTASSAGRSG